MSFIAGYLCGASVVVFLLALIVHLLHHMRTNKEEPPYQSLDEFTSALYDESEQLLQEIIQSISERSKKGK